MIFCHRAIFAVLSLIFAIFALTMEDYIKELNTQQQEAVLYNDGPQLVIAGAGSGKTRVLTYKIVHLLCHGYEPWRILALTFTNKAAREMRERIKSVVGESTASKIWMGTFHSIFARILRQNADRIGFKRSFTIYDTADSKSLVKTIIKDLELDEKIYKPAAVLSAISSAKNALISPERYALAKDIMEADRRAKRPRLYEIYSAYCNRCFVAGAMDFDDLLYYTNLLLRDNPDVLNHYREFFRYVLVDEYQDTNFAQHVIVTQLTKGNDKLCVVGDDAQSIYSFRGANIRNILELKNSYPALRTFKLEQNYRSTQNIINAANSLIEKNKEQIKKNVFSRNDKGARIEVVKSYSDFEEAYLVANRISQMKMRQQDSYDEYAILYRTNAQSRTLEESLRKRNIPYRIYGGLSFYQRKEIKDAVAYFRLAVNPDDDEALKRIINVPSRGIGETTLNKLFRCAIDNNVSAWDVMHDPINYNPGFNSATAKKIAGFYDMIDGFISMNLSGANADELVRHIITKTGLMNAYMSDNTPENVSKRENLAELLNGVKEFVDGKLQSGETDVTLSDFLGEVSLATDQDAATDGDESSVTLMTVHAAKGLEFSNVFIVGAEEELFPAAMSMDSMAAIEEERRLMYVAITRAKLNCTISYARSRFRNGQTMSCRPSRFIKDINPVYLHLSDSDDVNSSRPNGFINPIDNYRSQPSAERRVTFSHPLTDHRKVEPSSRPMSAPSSEGGEALHFISELKSGMLIEHSRFGRGVIESVATEPTGDKIEVKFENLGTKKLLLKFARFKIINQ